MSAAARQVQEHLLGFDDWKFWLQNDYLRECGNVEKNVLRVLMFVGFSTINLTVQCRAIHYGIWFYSNMAKFRNCYIVVTKRTKRKKFNKLYLRKNANNSFLNGRRELDRLREYK